MPIVNMELTDEEAARLDVIAARDKRARKYQAAIMIMEAVARAEEQHAAENSEKVNKPKVVATPTSKLS